MSAPLTVIGVGPFLGTAVLTAATTPALGSANAYDTRVVGSGLNVTMPDLTANVTIGSWMLLTKIKQDATANPVNFTCYGAQTFTSGETTLTLNDGGQTCIVQAISINGGASMQWQQIADFGAVGPAVRAAARKTVTSNGASPSSLTLNTDVTDVAKITALANALVLSTSGTPYDEQVLTVYITDNGTSRAISFDATKFGNALGVIGGLPAATPAGRRMKMTFVYDAGFARWILNAIDTVGYTS